MTAGTGDCQCGTLLQLQKKDNPTKGDSGKGQRPRPANTWRQGSVAQGVTPPHTHTLGSGPNSVFPEQRHFRGSEILEEELLE